MSLTASIQKGLTALLLIASAAVACAVLPEPGMPGAPADSRYCGEPLRDANGRIKRDMQARARFMATWPKPQDGREWFVDHVIPLEQGGCDMPHNMQWLPADLKTCAHTCKDRWERRVYHTPRSES